VRTQSHPLHISLQRCSFNRMLKWILQLCGWQRFTLASYVSMWLRTASPTVAEMPTAAMRVGSDLQLPAMFLCA
jgi:hypothetical protein